MSRVMSTRSSTRTCTCIGGRSVLKFRLFGGRRRCIALSSLHKRLQSLAYVGDMTEDLLLLLFSETFAYHTTHFAC